MTRYLIVFYFFFFCIVGAFAFDTTMVVKRVAAPIQFDGIPDEPAWNAVSPLPVVMHQPVFGNSPTELTEVLIAYDDEYIYLGGRLYDSEPEKMMANTKKRDALTANTEWFGLILDTYNDKENGLGFFTNPNGLRLDVSVFNDAVGEMPINISWNTFWDVKTQINGDGWFVEIRIPFSSLQFQEENNEVTMGVSIWRWMARKNELAIFPPIPPDYGMWSSWKPSQFAEIKLEGVTRRNPFYITPYVLGGIEQLHELNMSETAYDKVTEEKIEAGLDIKYGINSNLTLDLTLNTDFAQVEADDQQVNLTRFNLFFPEKRLFFQQRAGIFDFNFGRRDKLFYTRRIGIHEENIVRLYGGARLVGRVGDYDVGFMNMQTAALKDEEDPLNSENFTIARLRRQVINSNSFIGGILTNRMDFQGNYNTTYGADATIRFYENDYLDFRLAQTFENDKPNELLSLNPSRIWISASRQKFTGFTYGLSFSNSGKNFNPGVGFQNREDFTRFGSRLGYGWIGKEASWLNQHSISYRGVYYYSNANNSSETFRGGAGWEFLAKSGFFGEFRFEYNFENIFEAFDITDDVIIDTGEYSFSFLEGTFSTPDTRDISLMTSYEIGQFYDGKRFTVSFTPRWAVSPSLELSGTYEFNRLNFPDRNLETTLQVGRLKALYMLNTKFSVAAFIQYNSSIHTFLGNARLRYNPKEGNDLYIVFNDDINSNRERESPFLPYSNSRALILKYTYTFRL